MMGDVLVIPHHALQVALRNVALTQNFQARTN